MHGIVLKGLKDFVTAEYDREAWRAIQDAAGLGGEVYVPITEYDDADALALVEAASDVTGEDVSDLLDAFGRFLVPPLVETYGVHVEEDWTGLELVANVEAYIHEALRAKQLSTYTPPALASEWVGDDRVRVTYASDRELCSLAVGLLRGVESYYDAAFEIEERTCMHDGDDRCELVVRQ
ncbi:heme NO-binding domain-containing protein [Halorussus caseinilyticus]|uniref:heme NO-binding domain-containing protein n=1 Tax=Halorussus caseinilyticus TaxID=3034025 RepID=UPI0023E7C504|nr:heme NO-binding domain-containing protein [Halorussus sp. DT72]